MAERTAIVTGAHGFLGRHVARTLSSRGYTVYGIGHGAWTRQEWRSWGIAEWHACDVTRAALETYARDPSAIVHCAGGASVPFSMVNPLLDYQRTVDSTLSVLEFARTRAPSAALVLASSGSVYGSPRGAMAAESAPVDPQSPYAVHKLLAEQLCIEYGRFFGQRTVVVRLFSLHGPGLRKQLLWDACNKFRRGEVRFEGTGEELRDWLYVEDAAALVAVALDRAAWQCPIVNGGTGVPAVVRELLSELAAAMGLATHPEFSGAARPGDPFGFVADLTLARSWGWEPRMGWRDGVRAYCEWFLRGAP